MRQDIKELVRELKKENESRTEAMNRGNLSDYAHTVKVHTYNNTVDILNRLEAILKRHEC